ncbi:MAG: hypothetical protein N2255_01795 [Kiritimatiellae bacterium]|nr:hypothetical protein [Kiritimatiellia bacterium]
MKGCLVCLTVLMVALISQAATYYYVASNGDWDTAANWSLTSGGPGGAGIPVTGDTAIFDGNSGNCTCDANVTVDQLVMTSTYASVLDLGGRNLRINYAAGAGKIQIEGGEIKLGSGTHSIYGDWIYTAGTITPQTSTVAFFGYRTTTALPIPATEKTQVYGDFTLYNMRIAMENPSTGRFFTDIYGTIIVNGTLTIDGSAGSWGYTLDGNGEIKARGNIQRNYSFNPNTTVAGNVKLTIDGTGTQIQDWVGWQAGNYTVSKPSGTLVYQNYIFFRARGDNGNPSYFRFDSPVDFTSNSTTVEFFFQAGTSGSRCTWPGGAAVAVITGATDVVFYDLLLNGPSATGNAWADLSGKTVTVARDCTITLTPGWSRYVNNGTIDVKRNLTLNIGSGYTSHGTAILQMSGSTDATLAGPVLTEDCNSIVIAKTGGAKVTLTRDLGLANALENLTIQSGVLDLNGYNIRVDGNFTINDTLRLKGNETITVTPAKFLLSSSTSTVVYHDATVDAYLNKLPFSGTPTFNNLTFGAGKIHYFNAGATYRVNGILASSGTRSSQARLRSTVSGTQWLLNLQGTSSLGSGVDVQDSDARPGKRVKASGSTDSGNNLNWSFAEGTMFLLR